MNTSVATPPVTDTQGMNYLVSLPRTIVTVWVPLIAFLSLTGENVSTPRRA